MIHRKINGFKWTQNMIRKLTSFLEKCPVLCDFKTGINNTEDGVYIVHKGTDTKYFFPYNYEISEKDYIHNIYTTILPHYPRLIENLTEVVELTPEEIALEVEQGKDPIMVSKYKLKQIGCRIWILSKAIVWKNIAVLQLESLSFGENNADFKSQIVRYKYKKSLSTFLRKYRSNGYSSLDEASKEFFDNSMYLGELGLNNETTNESEGNGSEVE